MPQLSTHPEVAESAAYADERLAKQRASGRMKTAQGNMRHAGPAIMLSKCAQVVTDEMQDVQVR